MTILVVLLLMGALPGLAGGVALLARSPHPDQPGALLTRALASGVVTWTLATGILERVGGLSAPGLWILAGLLGGTSLVLLLLPRHRRVLVGARSELGHGVLLALLGLAAWAPVALLNLRTPWTLLGSTPWYYLDLARQVAVHGGVPETSPEWGTSAPFLGDYHLFTVATAGLIEVGPPDGILAAHAVVFLTVVLGSCGIAALALTLGASRLSACIAVPLFLSVHVFAVKLSSYRPEIFATVLLFPIAALAIDWLRRRDRTALIAGASLFALVSQAHGLMLFIAAAMVGGAMLYSLPGGGKGHVRRLASGTVVLVATWTGTILATAALLGTLTGSAHTGGLQRVTGLDDPTWEFIRAIRGLPPSMPPTNAEMASQALDRGFFGLDQAWFLMLLVAALLILVGGSILRGRKPKGKRSAVADVAEAEPDPRRVLLFVAGFAVVSMAFAAVFAFGWPTYVPRRAGDQRLLQVSPMMLPLVVSVAVWMVARVIRNPVARNGVVALVLIGSFVIGLVASARVVPAVEGQAPDRALLAQLDRLQLDEDDVVVVNGYTEGTVPQFLGASGLLDGRAPYTFPDLLSRANGLLRDAAQFYRNPAAHEDFLVEHDVDYVVWVRPGSWAMGTSNLFALRGRPGFRPPSFLTLVLARPGFAIYRVDHEDSSESGVMR